MGTYEEKGDAKNEGAKKSLKTCLACLWSILVSLAGGLMLVWWETKHHPTNSQLWMVPLGLILFVTPVIVWFAVFVSETCNSKEDQGRIIQPAIVVSVADSTLAV